ncbi:MAG: SDR family NAD(P)-dependent oxidoreductase [Desulfobacterales bacterium]
MVDVNESGLKTLASEIRFHSCFSGIMDVTDPESVKTEIDAFAATTGGRLDVLLNNAGILKFGLFKNVDLRSSSNC